MRAIVTYMYRLIAVILRLLAYLSLLICPLVTRFLDVTFKIPTRHLTTPLDYLLNFLSWSLGLASAAIVGSLFMLGREVFIKWANYGEAHRDSRTFFLYLRSFHAPDFKPPGVIGTANYDSKHLGRWPLFYWQSEYEYLDYLEKALRGYGRIVVIGEHEQMRSSYSTVFTLYVSDWFFAVRWFAPRARAIILEPGMSEGVVREIEFLRDHGLLDRTIIYMSPPGNVRAGSIKPPQTGTSEQTISPGYWQEVRNKVAEYGLHLPELLGDGGVMLRLNRNPLTAHSSPVGKDLSWRALRAALIPLLPESQQGSSFAGCLKEWDRLTEGQRVGDVNN